MKKVFNNLLDSIGNTPLIKLNRINRNPDVDVRVKLEYFNPGGSIKDRVALSMILEAERTGLLEGDRIILEATSGNTGIGLALVAAVKGYGVLLVMPKSVSSERRAILSALGAELILTPAEKGTDGAIEEAYRLARENPEDYCLMDQFNNPANPMAHYEGTAPEIWEQTGKNLDLVVATLGTTGTVMGITRKMKELNSAIKVLAVEPFDGHRIQGLKNLKESYTPGIFDRTVLDEHEYVNDKDAFNTARRLAKEEGIFCGMSSGAAAFVALARAEKMDGGTVVAILPDGGDRYLSTVLYQPIERPFLKKSDPWLYNTMTRRKEKFESQIQGKVTMYSCGPTVSAPPHIGHCRSFLLADLLKRHLQAKGYHVRHIMNITDIDDKTIGGSGREGVGLAEFSQKNIDEFMNVISRLNIIEASKYPRATEHVDDMIKMAKVLFDKGYAYEKHHSLYFDISRFEPYGRLSGLDLDKIKIGRTVDLDEYEKDNPRDFTILKRSTLSELKRGITYETEWGNVRPGWHLQCAAIATKFLGPTMDIHTSGEDLIFPHHENEIAQSEVATGSQYVRYWVNCRHLVVNKRKKMTRDHGVTIKLEDLLEEGFTASEVRFYLISTHYRKTLNFSRRALISSASALRKINLLIMNLRLLSPDGVGGEINGARESGIEIQKTIREALLKFEESLDDDLNIAGALRVVFGVSKFVNRTIRRSGLTVRSADDVLSFFRSVNKRLGVFDIDGKRPDQLEDIARLTKARQEARRTGQWEKADILRRELEDMGIRINDTPSGPLCYFDNSEAR